LVEGDLLEEKLEGAGARVQRRRAPTRQRSPKKGKSDKVVKQGARYKPKVHQMNLRPGRTKSGEAKKRKPKVPAKKRGPKRGGKKGDSEVAPRKRKRKAKAPKEGDSEVAPRKRKRKAKAKAPREGDSEVAPRGRKRKAKAPGKGSVGRKKKLKPTIDSPKKSVSEGT